MASKNVNSEVEAAAYVYALLNGANKEEASEEASLVNQIMEDDDDDLDDIEGIEEVLGGKAKKKAKEKVKATPKVKKKTDEEIEAEKALADRLEECTFAKLDKKGEVTVVFDSHVIPYKEQEWPIPRREVVYNILLVGSRQRARYISRICNNENKDKMNMAESGELRYYEIIVPFSTAVPSKVTTLGYVEVSNNRKYRIFANKKVLEENYISYDKTIKSINAQLKDIIKYV